MHASVTWLMVHYIQRSFSTYEWLRRRRSAGYELHVENIMPETREKLDKLSFHLGKCLFDGTRARCKNEKHSTRRGVFCVQIHEGNSTVTGESIHLWMDQWSCNCNHHSRNECNRTHCDETKERKHKTRRHARLQTSTRWICGSVWWWGASVHRRTRQVQITHALVHRSRDGMVNVHTKDEMKWEKNTIATPRFVIVMVVVNFVIVVSDALQCVLPTFLSFATCWTLLFWHAMMTRGTWSTRGDARNSNHSQNHRIKTRTHE